LLEFPMLSRSNFRVGKYVCVFALSALATPLILAAQNAPAPLTARQVIQKIEDTIHAPTDPKTVDTIKQGDPETPVTGIATTFLDTYEVLEKAVASGKNLIITHEPTFYNHQDDIAPLADDPVLAQKRAYIQEHHLVVWRFHDQWHFRKPDGILEGVVDALHWQRYQSTTNPLLFTLPPTTLAQLGASLQRTFGARSIRIVGDAKMRVTSIAMLPGAAGEAEQVKLLEDSSVQVLIAGEAREWETVEYARDASAQHRQKALILLGHEVSEEPGMENCAHWLRNLFPGVPIEFIPAGEPFWTTRSSATKSR
jgi:putative NIF3 family GTP cyclohydrolase 1 type 2